MKTKILMFYSYKGGSGRTVASGNVAAALANKGKKVLIIDMDFESPGLQTLFNVTKSEKYRKGLGLQDYLKGDISRENVRSKIILNLGDRSEEGIHPLSIENGGKLLYLMAAQRTHVLFKDEQHQLNTRMEALIEDLCNSEDLDYVILDAASGIREAYTLALHISHSIMILFRWTRQHFMGTQKVIYMLKMMEDTLDPDETPVPDFRLIASAVPGREELADLNNAALSAKLFRIIERNRTQLKEKFQKRGEIFAEIPEMIELKWQESILIFNKKDLAYHKIANQIIEM